MKEKDAYEGLKLKNQLCFPLYACSRAVVRLYTPYLKPLGITYTQYITLMVLWEEKEISVGDLGKKLYLDSGTLTPMLKKLECDGIVNRFRSESDERIVIVSLTDKGEALKEEAKDIPAKIGNCLSLDKEDALELYELLYGILNEVYKE